MVVMELIPTRHPATIKLQLTQLRIPITIVDLAIITTDRQATGTVMATVVNQTARNVVLVVWLERNVSNVAYA